MVNGIIGSSTGPPFLILSFRFLKEFKSSPPPPPARGLHPVWVSWCMSTHWSLQPLVPKPSQLKPLLQSQVETNFVDVQHLKLLINRIPLRITDSTKAWFCGSGILNKVGWFWCLMSLPIHMRVSVSRSEDKSNQNKFRPTVHQFDQPRDKWTISLVVPTPCLESASP